MRYHCDICGMIRELAYIPRSYRLPDGRERVMEQRHIWCDECNDISVAESFSRDQEAIASDKCQLDELRKLVKNPSRISSSTSAYLTNSIENAASTLAELELRIKESDELWRLWLHLRRAPRRCLRCGNTQIVVPSDPHASLLHPDCGTLRCTVYFGSFNGRPVHPHIYNVDGELIELGRRSTLTSPECDLLELFSLPVF